MVIPQWWGTWDQWRAQYNEHNARNAKLVMPSARAVVQTIKHDAVQNGMAKGYIYINENVHARNTGIGNNCDLVREFWNSRYHNDFLKMGIWTNVIRNDYGVCMLRWEADRSQ